MPTSSRCLFGGDRPAYPAVPVATYGAAMLAVQAVCAALVERERTGRGQHLSTSLMDAVSVFDMVTWAPGGDLSLRVADNPLLFYTVGRTRDGVWLQFSQNSPRLFRAFLQAIDLEQLLDEPRYKGAPSFVSPVDGREMRAVLMARIGERTWAEWQEVFAADPNVSAEEFARPGDALAHPQLLHTGDSRTVEDPARGPVTWLGPLIDAPVAPAIVHAPAPPDPASTAPPAWRAAPVAPAAPAAPAAAVRVGRVVGHADGHLLQGITVLELSTWIATPTSSSLLGDMGARVIKIEPLEGDPVRQHGLAAMRTVQGKECILIDLKAPAGRDVMHRLAAHADVLLHNYRPGVPERLGIDYETLRGVNPRLVYLYAASYGSTGPMAARPAFHVTCGAVCGGALAQAGAGNPPLPGVELSPEELAHWSYYLSKSNEANPDYNAGLAAAAAITMALYHRSRTGVGQALETRMMLSNSYTLSEHFIDFPGRPPRVLPDQQVFGLHALMRLYPAASGWVCVAAPSAAEFARLCDGLGRPDVAADARFASEKARRVHDADLASVLGAVLATRTAGEWEAATRAEGHRVRRGASRPARVVRVRRTVGRGARVRRDHPSHRRRALPPLREGGAHRVRPRPLDGRGRRGRRHPQRARERGLLTVRRRRAPRRRRRRRARRRLALRPPERARRRCSGSPRRPGPTGPAAPLRIARPLPVRPAGCRSAGGCWSAQRLLVRPWRDFRAMWFSCRASRLVRASSVSGAAKIAPPRPRRRQPGYGRGARSHRRWRQVMRRPRWAAAMAQRVATVGR